MSVGTIVRFAQFSLDTTEGKTFDWFPASIPDIAKWADARGVDAAIWTALGPKFSNQKVAPSADQVLEYLRRLMSTVRDNAEQYVERTPRQIDTEYRRRIEAALGWTIQWPVFA